MQSRCVTRRTTVGLEGGEFILHPQADEIMAWFQANHPNYTLLSNCLAPRRVIDAVRRYQPRHLYVSLDGGRETYQRMRGRDGYDRVIEVVEALKDEVPLSLMFCLSPWNTFEDMAYVINNQVYTQGYYSEIEAFISQTERLRAGKRSTGMERRSEVTTSLMSVRSTYELLQTLQSKRKYTFGQNNDMSSSKNGSVDISSA